MDSGGFTGFTPAAGTNKPIIQLYESSLKCKDPYGEIANEFPYIDWVSVINVCSVPAPLSSSYSSRTLHIPLDINYFI